MIHHLVLNFQDERSRWAITPVALERLHAALPDDWRLINVNAPVSSRGDGSGVSPQALAAVHDAEVYAGFGFPRELFLAAPKIKWVHTGTAGVASLLYKEMLESDVVVTNSAGIHAPPMAETVIGMILHFARGFDFAVRAQARLEWDQTAFETTDSPIIEVAGATLGIIGMGGVGRETAQRARALGMRVLGIRRSEGDVPLTELLQQSDFILISTPSTPDTKGLIGARELGLMKPGSVIINVARGNIIDQEALVEALRSGRLRGAALDVVTPEPLPVDSPLWRLPNVLILPHVSATTPRFWDREIALLEDNLRRYLAGKALRNVVDKSAGY